MGTKQKNIPIRKCVVSRTQHPKQALIRVVRTPDGEVKIDVQGKMNGRGVYLSKSTAIIQKAQKANVLARHLKTEVAPEIYTELQRMVEQDEGS